MIQFLGARTAYAIGFAQSLLLSCTAFGANPTVIAHQGTADSAPSRHLVKAALWFEKNQGQAPSAIKYLARTPSYTLLLESSKAVIVLRRKDAASNAAVTERVTLSFVGAQPSEPAEDSDPLPGKVNYLIGSDPQQWHRDVPTFRSIRYKDLYKNTDLVFYGTNSDLEFDLAANPGANPESIAFAFNSSAGKIVPKITATGDAVISTIAGELHFHRPSVYQQGRTLSRRDESLTKAAVTGKYVVNSNGVVRFLLGSYDRESALIIDPVLSYSTYLGGSGDEGIFGIRKNAKAEIFLAGETSSLDFPLENPIQPTQRGSYDAFVSKFDSSGTRLNYSTFLGGSAYDHAIGLALDQENNAYIAGLTQSVNFPLVHPLQPALKGVFNVFVAKLDPSGSRLLFSTYLGGSKNDFVADLALDTERNLYLTGDTTSPDFPVTTNALQRTCDGPHAFGPVECTGDAFVTKLNASGTKILYSTFLGGNATDGAYGIAVDDGGSAYVTGQTGSADFPVANAYQATYGGLFDAFVSKLSPDGSTLVFSTYLGGSSSDAGTAVTLDLAGDVYVTGTTQSLDFPLVDAFQTSNKGGQSDGFFAKFPSDGSQLLKSSYFGGSGWDYPFRLSVDVFGSVSIVGFTGSTDFPTTEAVQQQFGGGGTDAFVLKLLPRSFRPLYSTYLGGTGGEYGYAILSDLFGDVWVGGSTSSLNYPVIHPYQPAYAGGSYDAFLTHLHLSLPDFVRLLEDLLGGLYDESDGASPSADHAVFGMQQGFLKGDQVSALSFLDRIESRITQASEQGKISAAREGELREAVRLVKVRIESELVDR